MIAHYLITALRHLWKYKVQNLIGIAGLAAGLFCFSVCFYFCYLTSSVDSCYEKRDRLVTLMVEKPPHELDSEGEKKPIFSLTLANELREQSFSSTEAFCQVTISEVQPYLIEIERGKRVLYELNSIEVDTFYNQLFTPEIYQGDWEVIKNTQNAIILTQTSARRIFGKGVNPIGKLMRLSSQRSAFYDPSKEEVMYIVQGVMNDLPLNISSSPYQHLDLIVVNDTEGGIYGGNKAKSFRRKICYTFALLREGFTSEYMREELEEKRNRIKYAAGSGAKIIAQTIGEFQDEYSSGWQWFLFLTGSLILLAGLLNFFYFLVVSFGNRMHEYGIRKVVGGDSLNLFVLLWTQTFLAICFVGLLFVIFIEVLSPYLGYETKLVTIPVDSRLLYLHAIVYWGGVLVACALVCIAITFFLQRKARSRGLFVVIRKGRTGYMRYTIIGIQFFVCLLFVSCTVGLFLQERKIAKELWATLSLNEKKNIIKVDLSYSFLLPQDKEVFINRIAAFSGVEIVSRTSMDIAWHYSSVSFMEKEEQENSDESVAATIYWVDSCFFELMNLTVLSGQVTGDRGIIINEKLATRYEEVLGRTFRVGGSPSIVSGVVENVMPDVGSDYTKGAYFLFQTRTQEDPNYCYIKVYPGQKRKVRISVERELHKIFPESVEIRKLTTLADDISKRQFQESGMKNLVLLFSLVCLLITVLGVYAAITLDADRRQKEMAVRKVNGAKEKDIALIFVREYIVLLLLAALCAFPVTYLLLKKWFESYAITYEYGPLFWIGIFLFVAVIVALTIFFKVLRITRVNPAEIIKSE